MRHIWPIAGAMTLLVGACQSADQADAPPRYLGIETRLMQDTLVNFHVEMAGAVEEEQLEIYARCAAAQYALIRGHGFARHVRTNVDKSNGVWEADAVYTISAALPEGLKTIDAEVTVASCKESGIPTV